MASKRPVWRTLIPDDSRPGGLCYAADISAGVVAAELPAAKHWLGDTTP